MLIAWRVVTVTGKGERIVIAERIFWEKAQEIRVNLAKRGKRTFVELEILPDDTRSVHRFLSNLIGRPRCIGLPTSV